MTTGFQGWGAVAELLRARARQQSNELELGNTSFLDLGQCASLYAIAERIEQHGVIVADEVGMGKTRIAVEVALGLKQAGGRAAIVIPPGLNFQWLNEFRNPAGPYGGLNVPDVIRSLGTYYGPWYEKPTGRYWNDESIVIISHLFARWTIKDSPLAHWRWGIVPALYKRWRKSQNRNKPKDYETLLSIPDFVEDAAEHIFGTLQSDRGSVERLTEMFRDQPWENLRKHGYYVKGEDYRPFLKELIGLGLGRFDLVVIDEAHKNRGPASGLSDLLNNVVQTHGNDSRRVALTATPMELYPDDWKNTLRRIGLDEQRLKPIQDGITSYAAATERVRLAWRTSPDAVDEFVRIAGLFHEALAPYLIRRDKRQDEAVIALQRQTGLSIDKYRIQCPIRIDPEDLDKRWQEAVFAAEGLHFAALGSGDDLAKRVRLTVANGHFISSVLDGTVPPKGKEDMWQQEYERKDASKTDNGEPPVKADPTGSRADRIEYWYRRIRRAISHRNGDPLYEHPAITKVIDEIESAVETGEKVLVFGRFTRPLKALVEMLDARALLKCFAAEQYWPQSKIRDSQKRAVEAARKRLGLHVDLDKIDRELKRRYERERRKRESLRGTLLSKLHEGFREQAGASNARYVSILRAFEKSARDQKGRIAEEHPLNLLIRALRDLAPDNDKPEPKDLANDFIRLVRTLTDRDDDEDDALDAEAAADLWKEIEDRLVGEYRGLQGGFARLMYGGTEPHARRVMQLKFNGKGTFPKVLVAQSLVGREGLNLHTACRIVVLLHPEWNPGAVEQQIGRVDRVGSWWSEELKRAIRENTPPNELPRIVIRPVIFRGTYDEHNWNVLWKRWDSVRAQLHGIIVEAPEDPTPEEQIILDRINAARPDFLPKPLLEEQVRA